MAVGHALSSSTGFLYTNEAGDIVFADRDFQLLTNRMTQRELIGIPLYQALGIDAEHADSFLNELRDAGRINDRRMELIDSNGERLSVLIKGWGRYRDSAGFVGADLVLRTLSAEEALLDSQPETDMGEQAISASVLKLIEGAATLDSVTVLGLYTTAQVEALEIMIGRAMNVSFQAKLEAKINEAAQQDGWPIEIQDGHLTIDSDDPEAFRIVIDEAVSFCVNILGAKSVKKTLEFIDLQLDNSILTMVESSGIRAATGL